MDKIHAFLIRLGLTDTEAHIYRAGLEVPSIGVHELTKETNIKRPTIYHALETLLQKGLISKKGTGKRLVFVMSNPENLKRLLDSRIREIEEEKKSIDDFIPILLTATNKETTNIQTVQYEGIEGIKSVVEEALYCKSRHWDILAPTQNFFSEFDKSYAAYFMNARNSRGLTARTLWEPRPIEKRSTSRILSVEQIRARNPRYLPEHLIGKFKSVLIIFDDKVAVITSLQQKTAILITSQEIHDTISTLFEGLWMVSKEYKKAVNKST